MPALNFSRVAEPTRLVVVPLQREKTQASLECSQCVWCHGKAPVVRSCVPTSTKLSITIELTDWKSGSRGSIDLYAIDLAAARSSCSSSILARARKDHYGLEDPLEEDHWLAYYSYRSQRRPLQASGG